MRLQLPGDVHAPSRARAFVHQQLATAPLAPRLDNDDVVLVTSELVTNAVRAGANHVWVSLEVDPPCLELFVEDDATGWPTQRDAVHDATTGRGLSIVETLTAHWSVQSAGPVKRVLAAFDLQPGSVRC